MNAVLHPYGNVYKISLTHAGPIEIPYGAISFSIPAIIKNTGVQTWDTSDLLRVAIMLVEMHQRDVVIPQTLVTGRVIFDRQYILPGEEYEFSVNLPVNLIPVGSYFMMLDLVVDSKYYLVSTGAERAVFDVLIRPKTVVEYANVPLVEMPPSAPRRKWSLDPEDPSQSHAFRASFNKTHDMATRRVAVVFEWGLHYFRHYAHFLEFAICLYALCCEHVGFPDEVFLLIGGQEFSAGGNPDVQRLILNSIFKDWSVLHHTDLASVQEVTDVIYFSGSRQHTSMNRLLVDYRDIVGAWFASFRDRCSGNIRPISNSRNSKMALYAKRGSSRALDKSVEHNLFCLLERYGYSLETVDFGSMTIDEQIGRTKRASLLFGVHGNNLTNAIWLSKDACLIELFPKGFHSYDFQILCETAGSRYLGVEGVEYGFVHREGTRTPGWNLLPAPYCSLDHHNDPVTYVPLEMIASFLAGLI